MAQPGRRIILQRHGKTAMNSTYMASQDVVRGWENPPLTAEGKKEAQQAGQTLKKKSYTVDAIVCSDMRRAQQTAQIIGDILGLPVTPSSGMRPWDLGEIAGMEVKKAKPIIKSYVLNPNKKVPQGESFNSFRTRFFTALKDILDQSRGKEILLVAHSRNERLLSAWQKAGSKSDLSVDVNEFVAEPEDTGMAKDFIINERNIGARSDKASSNFLGQAMISKA